MIYSLLTALTWALTGIFIAFIDGLGFIEITWARSAIALLVFLPFSLIEISFKKKYIYLSSMMSFYYIFATTAFTLAPVSCVALLISTSPLFTIIFKIVKNDSIQKELIIGSIIGFFGIAVFFSIYLKNDISISSGFLYGCFFSTFAAFLKGLYSFNLSKNVNISSKNLTIITFIINTIFLLPFVSFNLFPDIIHVNYLYLSMLAIISTILPTLFNSIASKKIDSTIHTSICLLTSVFASFLAYFMLEQELFLIQIFGTLITILGILISSGNIHLSQKSNRP